MNNNWTYNKDEGNYTDDEGNVYIIRAGRPIKIRSSETKKEDTALHYGDLGKARDTSFFAITSSNRSTGHFGTGTYFVKDENSNIGDIKNTRPKQTVDISEYNLYKTSIDSQAKVLHEGLKRLDNGDFDENNFDLKLALVLNNKHSQEEVNNAINKTKSYYNDFQNESLDNKLKGDSPATVFMKELGYDGVDVRDNPSLDDAQYGTVIYNLKEEANISGDIDNKKETFYRYHVGNIEKDFDYNKSVSSHETGYGLAFRNDDLYTKDKSLDNIIEIKIKSNDDYLQNTDNVISSDNVNKLNDVFNKYIPDIKAFSDGMTESDIINNINNASKIISYNFDNNTAKDSWNEFYEVLNKNGYIFTDKDDSKTIVIKDISNVSESNMVEVAPGVYEIKKTEQ